MKRYFFSVLISVLVLISCGHTHEPSPKMTEVIKLNTQLWEDLNSAKSDVKVRIQTASITEGELDSLTKADLTSELVFLLEQKDKLKELDAKIPALEGYEPKCNHEPGEPHNHNNVKVDGLPEEELLELHLLLKKELDEVKKALK